MLGNAFTVTNHTPGTAAANSTFTFTPYKPCTLIHVSAVGSNANNATLTVYRNGTTAVTKVVDVGDSGTPAVIAREDFIGGEYPHFAGTDTIVAVLDYDGSSGTAVQNFSVVYTFLEG